MGSLLNLGCGRRRCYSSRVAVIGLEGKERYSRGVFASFWHLPKSIIYISLYWKTYFKGRSWDFQILGVLWDLPQHGTENKIALKIGLAFYLLSPYSEGRGSFFWLPFEQDRFHSGVCLGFPIHKCGPLPVKWHRATSCSDEDCQWDCKLPASYFSFFHTFI